MEHETQSFDLAVAWTWEHDRDFVGLVADCAAQKGVKFFQVDRENIGAVLDDVKHRRLRIRWFLDRASDEDENFLPLTRHLLRSFRADGAERVAGLLNPHDMQLRAADKATMHLEFLSHGIEVPYTIIVSPYNHKREVELSLSELAKLGRPFIIKPANTTGGGIGVVMGAETLKEVIEARQAHKNDKYLLQETIKPVYLSDDRAWFRVFYAFGQIIACWWDDQTHLYRELSEEEERSFGLERLRGVASTIRDICQLDFFSTELVMTSETRFVAVDYVNELCDMRLQSKFRDGVPDAIVRRVASLMVESASKM